MNSNSNIPAPEDDPSLRSITKMVDFSDRTISKTSHFMARFLSEYTDNWNDDACRTGGFRERFHRHREAWGRHRACGGDTTKLGQNPELAGGFSADKSTWQLGGGSGGESIPLDKSKPTNLWSYPVPTTAQHDKCAELSGDGVWTREGVWRCLFPLDKRQIDNEVQKGSANAPLSQQKLFGDYTDYLDWKSGIRKAMSKQQELDRAVARMEQEKLQERAEAQKQAQRQALEERWQRSSERVEPYQQQNRWDQSAAQNPSRPVKERWEAAAPVNAKSGKSIASTSTTSETTTKPDGSLETKQVVQTWYKDGTSSVSERITTGAQKASDGSNASGWFWK